MSLKQTINHGVRRSLCLVVSMIFMDIGILGNKINFQGKIANCKCVIAISKYYKFTLELEYNFGGRVKERFLVSAHKRMREYLIF